MGTKETKSTAREGREDIAWDKIFRKLKAWRRSKAKDEADLSVPDDPFVSVIADEYGRKTNPGWAVLVSTILSLRTKDDVTGRTSRALLAKAPSAARLLELPLEEVARLAYPAGFYRTKAASLKKIAAILVDEYGGLVPPSLDALLALPGVGRKTANLVLSEAFGMDAICVDIHVHRICNRAGWVKTTKPDKTEEALAASLPRKFWKEINGLLVNYGQNLCRPVSPFCSRCVIREFCERIFEGKSR